MGVSNMVTVQCCSLRSMGIAALPFRKLHPPPQQSGRIMRNVVLNLPQNSKNGSVLLPSRCSCKRGFHFPPESIGREQSSSLVCFAAADSPSSSPDSIPPTTDAACSTSDSGVEEANPKSFWQNWRTNAAELRAKASKWGLAAVLAYGLFDGITYTTFFVLAFLSYEKTTGNNPAANLKALLGVVVLMWGGNNVTRPFRVAGAAALAPFIDRGLKKMQEVLKLPNQLFAFMICVATFACACFSVVAVLILSRLGK